MNKTILFCADGTWNGPETVSDGKLDTHKSPTNVYKLFTRLMGTPTDDHWGLGFLNSIEKRATNSDKSREQVAMYCHGVGDNHYLPSEKYLGGLFGAGMTTRLRLGYEFISREYSAGDTIIIIGFSRGAYTARALADMVGAVGVLRQDVAQSHGPFSAAASAWLQYLAGAFTTTDDLAMHSSHFVALSEKVHETLLGKTLSKDDFIADVEIAAVAVWDTVGSIGVSFVDGDTRIDHYNLASETLGSHIKVALHAVSLDEKRILFTPTLWKRVGAENRLTQTLFAGDHSDVGGGHPDQSLSELTLAWMMAQLEATQLPILWNTPISNAHAANALGPAHEHGELIPAKLICDRRFDPETYSLSVSQSVRDRIGHNVKVGNRIALYDPPALPTSLR